LCCSRWWGCSFAHFWRYLRETLLTFWWLTYTVGMVGVWEHGDKCINFFSYLFDRHKFNSINRLTFSRIGIIS
jgi:hypothetical protein